MVLSSLDCDGPWKEARDLDLEEASVLSLAPEIKFEVTDPALQPRCEHISELDLLRAIHKRSKLVTSLDGLRSVIAQSE